ncbi:MAG: hypothetical protein COV47_01390 [Candidatus Diapherotrites archaeon CG11_big_fil_rev_8_21_14_0_20_37_9]|nr:MAG: hypothetical protein COV47_01390 [Candidatus Diapherotrites archaeon CG11_big_fil_rev_8_21_14_0_20_37_9]
MKTSKGQAVVMDFAFALGLFIILFTFISAEFTQQVNTSERKSTFDSLRVKADFVMETLVKSTGSPQNWETLSLNDVEYFGLAASDRDLSDAKLTSFQNNTTSEPDYLITKQKLGLEGYDYYFVLEDAGIQSGLEVPVGTDATQVVVERIVTYQGGAYHARLTVYKTENFN